MTEQEIIEIEKDNYLIAEFMELNYLDYNIDWRVLMPVWEKFRELQFKDSSVSALHINYCARISHKLAYGTIGEVHKILVYGIQWYNNQTSKP
jgi:hypothetical protein